MAITTANGDLRVIIISSLKSLAQNAVVAKKANQKIGIENRTSSIILQVYETLV